MTGSIQRLEGMGIDFDGTSSQLKIKDQAKLDAALQDHPDEVQALFNGTGGLVSSINSFVTATTGTTGLVATETARFTTDSAGIDTQIANMERRILQEQARLIASFVAMEQAQALIQQQSAAFNNTFGLTKSS